MKAWRRLSIVSVISVCAGFIICLVIVTRSHAQSETEKEGRLLELEGKELELAVHAADKTVTTKTLQYQGRAREAFFLIETERQLGHIVGSYGYVVPRVDFEKNVVAYVPSSNPACVEIAVDMVVIEDDRLSSVVRSEIFRGGAEKEGKKCFALVVIPKSFVQK